MAKDIFDVVTGLRASGRPFAVATVVETTGSVSAKTSSKAVIDENGRVVAGWVGGGCAESATCHTAIQCIQSGQTAILEVDMDDEVLGAGMPCGGHMRVYVEPVLPRPTLWIMGHGRVAECLCSLADMVGLDVVVNDPMVDRERYPAASRLITDDLDYGTLAPAPGDFVVIATQHKGDHLSMKRALSSGVRYIALIASRKRSRLVLDYLRQEGMGEQEIERVMAPSGLDLGARTPEEIALCVISEIVLVRRGGTGLRMRDKLRDEREKPRLKAARV
ncbi:MAG: XdhC family protein [Gammaproteobacteria bacterium]|nr:XdhC family protein [Gammaproteobacteria bacterium]MDH4255516.1 XdhC family protein [Gammaproteobacteria bacterium]